MEFVPVNMEHFSELKSDYPAPRTTHLCIVQHGKDSGEFKSRLTVNGSSQNLSLEEVYAAVGSKQALRV
jgi:hypothetical protein